MRKNKSALQVIGLGCLTVISLTACGAPSGGNGESADGENSMGSLEDMAPVTLTLPDLHAEGDLWSQDIKAFVQAVEERSGGKITFDLYFSESLVPTTEAAQAISDGTADLGLIFPSHNPSVSPVGAYVLELGALATPSFPHGSIQSSGAATEAYYTMDELLAEQDQLNVDAKWSIGISQGYDMLCATEVNTLDDLQGLRVRTAGEPWVSEVESLGMTAVSMQGGEVYEALQRGTIDCTTMSPNGFIAWDYWDVAKYYVPMAMSPFSSTPFYVNRDTWASLPGDAQELLEEEIQKLGVAGAATFANAYHLWMKEADDKGIIFVNTSEMDPILQAQQAAHRQEMLDRAPAGIADPEAFITKIEALHDDWLDITVDGLGSSLVDASDTKAVQDSFMNYETEMWSFLKDAMSERVGKPLLG